MKVLIKTWDQMEEEFGLTYDGDIDCDSLFAKGMEALMPHDRVIKVNDYDLPKGLYSWRSWVISDDMIALRNIDTKEENVVNDTFKEIFNLKGDQDG